MWLFEATSQVAPLDLDELPPDSDDCYFWGDYYQSDSVLVEILPISSIKKIMRTFPY